MIFSSGRESPKATGIHVRDMYTQTANAGDNQIQRKKSENVCRQTYSFLEVKLQPMSQGLEKNHSIHSLPLPIPVQC